MAARGVARTLAALAALVAAGIGARDVSGLVGSGTVDFEAGRISATAAIDDVNDKPAPLGLIGMTQEQTLRLSVAYVSGFDPQPGIIVYDSHGLTDPWLAR